MTKEHLDLDRFRGYVANIPVGHYWMMRYTEQVNGHTAVTRHAIFRVRNDERYTQPYLTFQIGSKEYESPLSSDMDEVDPIRDIWQLMTEEMGIKPHAKQRSTYRKIEELGEDMKYIILKDKLLDFDIPETNPPNLRKMVSRWLSEKREKNNLPPL